MVCADRFPQSCFLFLASPKLQAIAEKSETPQARGPLRAVCSHVTATHRSYNLCQAASETGVLKFVVQVRVFVSPPQKGLSLPEGVKYYLHGTSNIDPIEPFITNKEMTPAFGFC